MADTTTDDQVMLTTLDNPYNPFTQYDEWFALDETRGYHTPGLLARYTITSDDLSDLDQEQAVKQGILDVIQLNPYGMYRMVTPADYSENS